MTETQKRTISLPAEHAHYIDQQVSSGSYASASEVVRAGLRALRERDEAVEKWLLSEVAPIYDAMQVDPERGVGIDDVFERVRVAHLERTKKSA